MDEQVTPVGSHHCNVVPVGVAVTKDFKLVGFYLFPAKYVALITVGGGGGTTFTKI